MGPSFLIVVTISEGRNFPHRQDRKLIIEAKFDGEIMSTDPIPHDKSPSFNTELAWEVDRKGLQLHRLQRSPIKLQCFVVDFEFIQKELIGYLILDIRLAHEKLQPPKWYPLLNSKYQRQRPEILISLHLEKTEQKQSEQPSSSSLSKKKKSIKSNVQNEVSSTVINDMPAIDKQETCLELKPKLNIENGVYYIGDPDSDKIEKFIFSVTIAFATNLLQLVQLYSSISSSSENFYFYYSLFGNDVTTEPFGNFQNPDFPAERASVKIISSIDILKEFFIQQPKLQIFFCCADVSIGIADIPISHILMEDAAKIEAHPISLEGTFEIVPQTENKLGPSSFEFDSRPEIGVCVMLQKMENEDKNKVLSSSNQISDSVSTSTSDASEILSKLLDVNIGTTAYSVKDKAQLEAYPSPPQRLRKAEDLKEKESEMPVQLLKEAVLQNNDVPRVSFVDNIISGSSSNFKNIDCSSQSLLVPHHFCFTIDLRTLKLTQQKSHLNCFLRYSYPFFGSTVPILTHPCIDIRSGVEVTLPHGYCAFNFATLHHQLESTFKEFPLIIEVIHRDKDGNQKDKFIGSIKLHLGTVLGESATTFARENGVIGMRQITTCSVPVLSEDQRQIGELLAVMSLDDLGPTNIPVVFTETNQQTSSQQCQFEPTSINKFAMEQHTKIFEEWKNEQELLLKEKLKQKEKEHMETLIFEWKKRDMERELLMQRKLREYQQMEERLKQALSDIEVRERHLTLNENKILSSKADLKHQKEIMEREANEIIKRIKEENEFMVEIERSKIEELNQKCKKYQEQISDLEKKLKERDILIQSMKEEREGSRESYLQADVKVLTNEKMDLVKKLEKAVSSKQRYKDQWGQALRKIAQLEQQILDLEKNAWLKKEEYEIIHLNKLAKMEQGNLQNEKETLNSIKDKLTNFTENYDENEQKRSNSESTGHYSATSDPNQTNFVIPHSASNISTVVQESDSSESRAQEFLQRLKEEKKILLSTGVYTEEDRIIIELNEHIQKAMNQL